MDKCCLLDEATRLKTELQNLSSGVPQEKKSNEPCKVQMLQVKEDKELSLQNQKRFMLQKSPANRKIRKSWWICWQQKPSLRRITRVVWHPRLKSSAMNLKLQVESQKTKSKNSWKENASVQLRFGSIVWVFAEGGYKHTNPVCGAMKYRTFYVGNLSFPAMGLHQQIRLSLIGSINYN